MMLDHILALFPKLRAIKVLMDSTASVSSLTKWRSRIEQINKVLIGITEILSQRDVTLDLEWTRRDNLKQADARSKIWETPAPLSEEALLKLLRQFPGVPISMPPPNKIPSELRRIQNLKDTVLVHPVWTHAKKWWPLITSARSNHTVIGNFQTTFNKQGPNLPQWTFHASLIPCTNKVI